MPYTAQFHSTCTECGSAIRVGDLIMRDEDDEAWVHVSCLVHTPDEPVKVCPRCFMTICDCGRD